MAYSVDSSFHRKEDFNYIRFFFNFKEDSKKAISIIDETFEELRNDEQSFKEEKQRRIAQSRTIDESIVEIRNVACEELIEQGKIILISEDVATLQNINFGEYQEFVKKMEELTGYIIIETR